MGKKKAAPTDAKLGPGKKACPECSEVVGVRTQVCPNCSHQFEAKIKSQPATRIPKSESSLKNALLAERDKLEDILANREALEDKLKAINELLSKM